MRRFVDWPFRTVQLWLAAAAFVLMALPGVASAQSACTAMWAVYSPTAATPWTLAYFNNQATGLKWTTTTVSLNGNANALAGDNNQTTPTLFYFDRTGLNLWSINMNTLVQTNRGTISPASPGGNGNILGATVDTSGNLILMGTTGAAGSPNWLALINKGGGNTSVRWQTVTFANLTLPPSGGSGDIFTDPSGVPWIITNTGPGTAYSVTITITNGSITSAIAGATRTFSGAPATIQGGAYNPLTGQAFFGGVTSGNSLFTFNPNSTNSQALTDTTANVGVSDMGNCSVAPVPPTVSKTISPGYRPGAGGTATLSVTITNPNWASIFLPNGFSDVFPAGMTIASVPNLVTSTGCIGVISAPAGSTSVTFAAGGRIPGGPSGSGCAFSLSVVGITSTTALTNTIPSGSVTTSAGTNALGVTATFKVGTDFSVLKLQATPTGELTAASVTFGAAQPVLYQLNIVNSAVGGTGSATFTDTLPGQITPVLAVTAVHTGGGSCTTATQVVAGRTIITGTVTNALAGSTCTVTVQGRTTSTLVATTPIVNTLTVAALAGTSDTDSANNRITVTASVSPATRLTITKTNLVTSLVAGQTTSYTITVVNFGPSIAPGATVTDPVTAGLACTAVTCAVAGGAVCPAGLTTTTFSTGVGIPTFPVNSTVTFTLRCNVTATGR